LNLVLPWVRVGDRVREALGLGKVRVRVRVRVRA